MHIERTTPISWIVAAVAGGVLFLLGGVVTTMSSTARFVMAGGAIALVALGVYTANVARRNVTLARRHGEMEAELAQMLRDDTSLRTRMAYTLRDPLTAIFGFADHLANSPEMPFDTRRAMLIAIRNDAREVEQSLSELAGLDGTATGGLSIEAVVLLDEEVASIASTITTDSIFESDLAPAKAWGDSAKVTDTSHNASRSNKLRTRLHHASILWRLDASHGLDFGSRRSAERVGDRRAHGEHGGGGQRRPSELCAQSRVRTSGLDAGFHRIREGIRHVPHRARASCGAK